MKKSMLLIIPFALSMMTLTGCKDYKYDNPASVIRNHSNGSKGVMLVYGYESNADSSDNVKMRDFNNVVIRNLKKATFTKGKLNVTSANKSIQFSLGSYYTSQGSIGVANFTLYDNGYITYRYPHYKDGKSYVDTFDFTFDATLADSIISQVYEEFDLAKAEEERFISTFTIENFFKTMAKQKSSVWLRNEDRSVETEYFDNGSVLEELKKIDYTPFTSESEPVNRGVWDVIYCDYPGSYSGRFDYEQGKVNWNLFVGKREDDSGWAYMALFGEDKYEKDYSLHAAYDLDIEQTETLITNARKISEGLEKVPKKK